MRHMRRAKAPSLAKCGSERARSEFLLATMTGKPNWEKRDRLYLISDALMGSAMATSLPLDAFPARHSLDKILTPVAVALRSQTSVKGMDTNAASFALDAARLPRNIINYTKL